MANRKLQLYVTGRPSDPSDDPFFRHVLEDEAPSGEPYSAEEAKRELYRQPR
jgi:hypothetical protein